MGMTLHLRRIAAWIACCAVLFAALAPSISHLLSSARGDTWAEMCGSGGVKLLKPAPDKAGDPARQAAQHIEHCPFCATHGASFALPPSPALSQRLLDMHDVVPHLFLQSPHPLPIWTAPPSRGPPALA